MAVALQARERLHGLGKDAAREQAAGSAIGRLVQCGALTPRQGEAAKEYEKVVTENRLTIGAKSPRSAGDFGGVGGYDADEGDDPDYIARCDRARERMAGTDRILLSAGANVRAAVDLWVMFDSEVFSLLGELKAGLDVLAAHYRVEQWQADERAA